MDDKQKFVADLYPAARKVSQETGMSWELILAQAAQETGWGKKVLEGTNNIFNIKVSADWTGPQKTFNVWEVEDNKKVWKDQSFRVYDSIEDALRDRVKFLEENPRYTKAGLFDVGTLGNLHSEAMALQKAGYATDPNYAKNLEQVFNSRTMSLGIALSTEQKVAIEATIPVLREGDKNPAVGELQNHLRDLGYADAQDRVLQADNKFGKSTREAVEAFQRDHGLRDDGMAGRYTLQAIQDQLALLDVAPVLAPELHDYRHTQVEALVTGSRMHDSGQQSRSGMSYGGTVVKAEPSLPLRTYDDPGHPQHVMYAKLKELLPAGTSEARLTQFTAACHMVGMDNPKELSGIHIRDTNVFFTANSLYKQAAKIDLLQPAPAVQETMQQVQSHDLLRAQSMAQFQAQQAQINAQAQQGPVLGGGPMR